MKTLLSILIIFSFFYIKISAQVFTENFEGATIGLTSTTSVTSGGSTWGINTRLASQGLKSDSVYVPLGGITWLTTTASFSTLGNYSVYLAFDQICKVTIFDSAYIEVSNDNGLTWQRALVSNYLGAGLFGNIGNRFNEGSYNSSWEPGVASTPQSNWWKHELFDISNLAANSANVKIRFALADGNNLGHKGRAGWFLDSIYVTAAVSELIPPSITLLSPIIQDTVYSGDPVNIYASISDNSGIDSAYCIVNCMPFGEQDTILMIHDANTVDTFSCQIPFYGFGRTTNYYVIAYDGSFLHNAASTATYSYITKYTTGGIAEIGNGTSSSSFPFYTYYHDGRSQFIYTAAEINASGAFAGPITSIAFNVITNATQAMNGFTIKMTNTSLSTLTGFEPGLTSVYSPASYTVAGTGWQTINLSTPFLWNGASNLLIEVCFDNSAYTSNSTVYSTSMPGKTWIRGVDNGTGCSLTGGYTQGVRPNIKINILGSSDLTNDIGVRNILNPNTGVIAGTDFEVKVDLKNYGIDTIRNGQISWTYDGIAQTPFMLTATDSILPDDLMSPIILDTLTSTLGGHTIVAWSEMPNGVIDKNIINDTAQYSFYGCASSLGGTYTIGGTGADFIDFAEATLALDQCGITSAVVFNVNSGVYNEQININNIPGNSSVNTVIFQSALGDSSTVIVKHLAIDTNNNYVVNVDAVSNITFSNMTFEALDNTYARVFVFKNDVSNITINNNIIKNTISANIDNDDMSLIIGNMGNNITISNNSMINSAFAINLYADIIGLNWNINNNHITNVFSTAIFLNNAKFANISSNIIYANSIINTGSFIGIDIYSNSGSLIINNNEIYSTVSQQSIGININICDFDSNDPAIIYNNFIQVNASTAATTNTKGISLYTIKNLYTYYNNINITGYQPNSASVYLGEISSGYTENVKFINNIFANSAQGYIYNTNSVDTSLWINHHNDLWNYNAPNFSYLNGNISDFTTWQTISGETNSININPYFVSSTNLHIVNNSMNATAIPLLGITTDIDGHIRNTSTPDIGADEFDPSPWDASIISFASINNGCGLSNEVITIQIKNLGSANINGALTASYRLSHTASIVTETISNPIATGDTLLYTFTNLANLDIYSHGKDSTFNIEAWVNLSSDLIANNDSSFIEIISKYTPLPPIVSDTLISYGGSVNLTAISTDSLIWFQTDTSNEELSINRWYQTGALFDTTTYWVGTTVGNPIFKITETVQYKTAPGATSPYPSYLPSTDFDGIEITNLGDIDGDLSGYTINYNTVSYTFPANTVIASGDIVLAVYASSLTIGPAGNNVFYTSYISVSSNTPVSYWLTDENGVVVDAFSSNGANFPSSSTVTSSDFTGSLMGGSSHPGAVRILSDNNDASDWEVISPALASFGTANSNLTIVSQESTGCHSTLMPLTVEVNNIPQNDLSIYELISPISGYYLYSNTNVKVRIANYGIIAKDTIPLAYQLNSSPIVNDTLFQTMNSGDITEFTFGQTVDLSQSASFNFKVYTNLNYDTEPSNDSIIKVITNDTLIYCPSYATTPSDSKIDEVILESISNNTSGGGCATYSNFSSISTYLSQGMNYQISVTLGSCGGNFTKGAKAWIDFNNNGNFNDNGEEIANFGSGNGNYTATATFTVPNNATLGRHKLRVVGRESVGSNNISIVPCGTYSYGETEDYYIDIVPLIQFDIGTIKVINIADTSYQGASITPIVIIKNYGFDTLTTFDIMYTVNGNTPVVYNYNSTLLPFQRDTVTLASFNSPAGINNICAYSSLSTDANAINDTTCITYYSIPTKDAKALAIQYIDEYCGMSHDTIRIQLTNLGIDTINAVGQTNPTTISYQSNFLSPVTEVFTQAVAPGDTAWYEFNNLVYVGSNSIMDSVYNIKAWINYIGDNVAYNDSTYYVVESQHSPSIPTVINPVIIPYASPATLIANNAPVDSILWFSDSLSTEAIFGGSPYTTPWLNTNDTIFWVASSSGAPSTSLIFGNGSTVNSTTGYPSPYANYYWGNKEQYLILASEIIALGGSAGPIGELAFDVSTINTCPNLLNFEIKIGNSTQSALTTYETGLTTVFSSLSGYQPVNGWNNHIFSSPFVWDGISNIVVQVCSQNSSYTQNASVKRTSTSFNSVRYYHSDATGVCSSTSGSSSSIRPNMKLLISSGGCQSDKTPVNINILPLSACDVGASNLIGPISAIYLNTSETITAEVQNYGNVDQTNIPISYQINGGTIITENVSVPASSSVNYSFNTKADFSTLGGQFIVELSTDLQCDTTSLNNSFQGLVSNIIPSYCISSANYTTSHDIENVTLAGINNTSLSPFDKVYTDFTNINPANLSPGNSSSISIKINSTSTSPSGGFVKVYIDFNRDGVFDPITEKAVGIPYNNASSNFAAMAYGSVSIPSTAQLGLTRMRVVVVASGTTTSVQPCGTYNYGETEDYSVYIANIIPNDASISMISSPDLITTASSVPVTVRVHNYGTNPITTVDISYSVNNNTPTVTTIGSTNINHGNYIDVPLGNITISDGMNNICAKTIMAGDSNTFNDSRCINVFKEAIVNLSYTDDFEGISLWMDDTLANQWERGIPSMNTINTAHSPNNIWAVNLNGNYSGGVQYLYSPKFVITSNIDTAKLKFWHWYNTEVSNDGAYIQYKKDNGIWLNLGYVTDPRTTNWYNNTSGGSHKWTGNSNGWIQSTFTFDFLSGEFQNTSSIQLRYIFYANSNNNNYDGWAIDDFEMALPAKPNDAGIININNSPNLQIGDIINVNIEVHNYGTTALTSIPVWYKIDNGAKISETYTPTSGSLAPNASESFIFSQTNALIENSSFIICSGTDLSNDAYPQNDDICQNYSASTANIDVGAIEVYKQQIWGGEDTTSILTPVNLYAVVKNYGLDTITSFDIEYSKDNGVVWYTETWTGNLAFEDVDTFHFATTYNSPLGNYSICVRTALNNDANNTNDEFCQPFIGVSLSNANNLEFVLEQNRPNPAFGIISINYIVPYNGNIEFKLRNTLGQIIYADNYPSTIGKNNIEIKTNDLPNGVYYYTVIFDNKRLTRKMIISN